MIELVSYSNAAARKRLAPCRVCRRGVSGGKRFCEAHDEIDLALAGLDAPARAAFRRCVDGGIGRGKALALAKDDLAIRARHGLALAPLTRAALLRQSARR